LLKRVFDLDLEHCPHSVGAVSRGLPRIASLPRPWIALLVSGNSSSSALSESVARDLVPVQRWISYAP
jgi:hypothetical protein